MVSADNRKHQLRRCGLRLAGSDGGECLKVAKTPMQRLFAYLYFLLVRTFGWAFYRYNK